MPAKKATAEKLKAEGLSRRSSPAFARRDDPPMFPPVNRAAMDNNVEKLVELLDKGANIEELDNDDRATPLIGACRYNKPDTALELIKRGANIDARTRDRGTAIGWAAVNGMVEVGRLLIEKGCDLNVQVNSRKTIPEYARDYSDRHPDFYKMVGEAIEARDRRIAAEAQAAADARAKAYAEGATVLNSPITVTKPITLKR
jgi:ankyrin repeat protein